MTARTGVNLLVGLLFLAQGFAASEAPTPHAAPATPPATVGAMTADMPCDHGSAGAHENCCCDDACTAVAACACAGAVAAFASAPALAGAAADPFAAVPPAVSLPPPRVTFRLRPPIALHG